MKKQFKVGDEITFNEANQLKNWYFAEAADKALGTLREYSPKGYLEYERLKRDFKKKTKFKIITLP